MMESQMTRRNRHGTNFWPLIISSRPLETLEPLKISAKRLWINFDWLSRTLKGELSFCRINAANFFLKHTGPWVNIR